ncbi:MAG: 50S ribosomal protein L23 [Bacilli bacterium]|nr:50S ribosomal protein L23 [Bacilli bacterium]
MADEKKVAATKEEKKAAPKKTEAKPVEKKAKAKKTEVKVDTTKQDIAKATHADFSVILNPIITEKSMAMIQNSNQATFKVKPTANKAEVKLAFERLFKVKAVHVSIVNVRAKSTSRGGRYQGKIQGYKKAIVTIKSGEAIDLFKE